MTGVEVSIRVYYDLKPAADIDIIPEEATLFNNNENPMLSLMPLKASLIY